MTELENALFCEKHNRMNREDTRSVERENAYATLQNMNNMLKEHLRANHDLPIPRGGRPSGRLMDRYGIDYDSEFHCIWVVLERLCNGEYELKQKEDVQPKY